MNALKFCASAIKCWTATLAMFVSVVLTGQNTFSIVSHSGYNGTYMGFVCKDDAYICTGGQVNLSQGVDYFGAIYRIDESGNKSDSLFVGSFDEFVASRFQVIDAFSDGTLLAGFRRIADLTSIVLLHFTPELTVIDTLEIISPYYDPGLEGSDFVDLSGLRIDPYDNVYISLNLHTSEESNFLGVFKYSPDFELLWEYYKTDAIRNTVSDLYVDSTGGVFGDIEINAPSATPSIQKLSSDGDLEWVFDFVIDDQFAAVSPRHIITNDGKVIVGTFMIFEGMIRESPVLVAFDFAGNQEWISVTDPQSIEGASLDAIAKTCDGGYVGAARSAVPVLVNDSIEASDLIEAQLIRFNHQGDIEWKRNFRLIDNPSSEHEIRQLEQTPDGGFFMVGEYLNTNIFDSTNVFPYQRQLIIKTDECGCLVPNCDPNCRSSNCQDFPAFEAGNFLLVGPSPTNGTLNVFVSNIEADQAYTLSLFAANGELIAQEQNLASDMTYIFDLQPFSAGMYILQLANNDGLLQTEKVMKY